MKKVQETLALVAIGVFAAMFPAVAQNLSPTTQTLSVEVLNQYIGPDNMKKLYPKGVTQLNYRASWDPGFYFNFWGSKSINDGPWTNNLGNELDYTVGFKNRIGWLEYDVSALYADTVADGLFRTPKDYMKFSVDLSVPFKFDSHTFAPFYRPRYAHSFNPTVPDKIIQQFGVRHNWKIADFVGLQHMLRFTYDPGFNRTNPGWNMRYDTALAWSFGDRWVLRAPFIRVFHMLSDVPDYRAHQTFTQYGIGIDKTW